MKPWQSFWNRNRRVAVLYGVGSLFFLLSALFACCAGSSGLSLSELLQGLSEGTESVFGKIVYLVRLPRLFATLICGAALAVSGCVIQSALANPLASPSTVGVGSGAALAVTICSAFGVMGGFTVSLAAFFGAFAAVSAVSVISAKLPNTKGTVILVGVALGAFFGAISDAIVQLSPEIAIYRNDFKIGDFSYLSTARILPAALMIVLALILLLFLSVPMDVLSLGDENAKGLGLNTKALRAVLLLLSAVLAGCAVSLCGLLSFVGLMVPHTIKRLWRGIKAFHLMLLCALYGAGFVTFCDTLSRTVFAPHEIPVGIFMAFLGAPFFLYLILSKKGDKRI
ncbi:MAG: iron ABC transporter permease [Clostridia bacterium]|nr:iron ABC transporter permease [Clostridia bacterium]